MLLAGLGSSLALLPSPSLGAAALTAARSRPRAARPSSSRSCSRNVDALVPPTLFAALGVLVAALLADRYRRSGPPWSRWPWPPAPSSIGPAVWTGFELGLNQGGRQRAVPRGARRACAALLAAAMPSRGSAGLSARRPPARGRRRPAWPARQQGGDGRAPVRRRSATPSTRTRARRSGCRRCRPGPAGAEPSCPGPLPRSTPSIPGRNGHAVPRARTHDDARILPTSPSCRTPSRATSASSPCASPPPAGPRASGCGSEQPPRYGGWSSPVATSPCADREVLEHRRRVPRCAGRRGQDPAGRAGDGRRRRTTVSDCSDDLAAAPRCRRSVERVLTTPQVIVSRAVTV